MNEFLGMLAAQTKIVIKLDTNDLIFILRKSCRKARILNFTSVQILLRTNLKKWIRNWKCDTVKDK